jgi:hypothetical protein
MTRITVLQSTTTHEAAKGQIPNRRLSPKKPHRRRDHRWVKQHRSYSIEEAAQTLRVHQNTVRFWISCGLPLVDRKRPHLIKGVDLIDFLKQRRSQNKRPCGPGQIYCLRCRAPRAPAAGMADYFARTDTTGDLIGLCPICETVIYRRISWSRLQEVRGPLEVQIMQPHLRIHGITAPRIVETCSWIARNLPFVDHVALMGLENTGFALANQNLLWIDPLDYRTDLTAAVGILSSVGVKVSVYNLPLCLLDHEIWPFAAQSISDWKNAYLPICGTCAVRDRCAGFFSTGRMRESRGILPLPPESHPARLSAMEP